MQYAIEDKTRFIFFVFFIFFFFHRQPSSGLANRDDNMDGMFAEIASHSVNSEQKLLAYNVRVL